MATDDKFRQMVESAITHAANASDLLQRVLDTLAGEEEADIEADLEGAFNGYKQAMDALSDAQERLFESPEGEP